MATIKEVVVYKDLRTEVRDVPLPKPGPGEVLIKVEVCGSNPKDFKTELVMFDFPINLGDDIAGTIAALGPDVTNFKVGDRVFAMHAIQHPHGGWASHAVAPAHTTARLADGVSFHDAATVPLAGLTAALALYGVLGLPQPWLPTRTPTPLLVYGASGAVGAFAVKLARLSGMHPIVAVAGAGSGFVRGLLDESEGDVVLDYRGKSVDELKEGIRAALKGTELGYAFDAVALGSTTTVCTGVLAESGRFAVAMPPDEGTKIPEGISWGVPNSTSPFKYSTWPETPGAPDFGLVMMQAFASWLADGRLKAHPYEVVPGGLDAIPKVLADLKAGKASAKKFVFEPAKTAGL